MKYPPGHFTELMRRHRWPPMFEPKFERTRELERSEMSRIARERRVALGDSGTICGLSDKSEASRMQRATSARYAK